MGAGDPASTSGSASAVSKAQREAWAEEDQRIEVVEEPGSDAWFKLLTQARVEGRPWLVYDVLTDPRNISIFRGIKACSYRKTISDDGKGRRHLEVGHRALTRFLFVSFTFETHLKVWEDDVNKTIHFTNAREGFMKKFDGLWTIRPMPQLSLEEAIAANSSADGPSSSSSHHHHHKHHDHHKHHHHHHHHHEDSQGHKHGHDGHHHHLNPLSVLSGLQHKLLNHHHHHQRLSERAKRTSFVTLEQSLTPRGPAPPGMKHLVRSLCAHQVRTMMEDLRSEVERRMAAEEGREPARIGYLWHGKLLATAPAPAVPVRRASAAASMTMSQPTINWDDIWQHAAPINITIQL